MYLAAPNCPNCLQRLEAEGSAAQPYWWCDACELVVLDVMEPAEAD